MTTTVGETMRELTGTEGGVWHVHTRDSIHVFDLDAWTVERKPGPNTWSDSSDGRRRLRTIKACRVGERGHWTMDSDDFFIDYYFHYSSVIQRIDQVDAGELGKEESQEPSRLDQL
jgi:hypothetical protein